MTSVAELDNKSLISYKPSLKNGKFREFCYDHNISFFEITSLNESDLYFNLIKDNFGIGFANKLLLKEYINDKSICIINVKEKIFTDTLSVAYTKKDIIIYSFISLLKEYINKEIS